jgi:hypothetical protein
MNVMAVGWLVGFLGLGCDPGVDLGCYQSQLLP